MAQQSVVTSMHIKLSSVDDAAFLAQYYIENHDHLQPWEPLRSLTAHSTPAWMDRLKQRALEQRAGRSAYFLAYSDTHRVIATCSLTGITRGAFQACFMGYSVAKDYEGRGVMKQVCQHVLDYAFNELNLNRIMANYMPRNERSGNLLKSLGFEEEGLAKNYLKINGQWEDHILTSKVNPNKRDKNKR